MKPIRVLHLIGSLDRAGAQTWLMHVLRRTDLDCFPTDLLVGDAIPRAYDEEARRLGCRIFVCHGSSRPSLWTRNFRGFLREEGPYDVVHGHQHHFSAFGLREAHLAKVPVRIAHSHTDSSRLDLTASPLRRPYLLLMRRWIAQHANYGVATSEQAAISLFGPQWRAASNCCVLHCGIDLSEFRIERKETLTRKSLDLPAGALVVTQVGRFVEAKNQLFTLEVFKRLLAREPMARLLLLGTGPKQAELQRRAAEMAITNAVRFAGVRSDVAAVLTQATDLFIMPSLYEGLGLALLEAQAAGVRSLISSEIPTEADRIHSLIHRLPLAASAEEWATQAVLLLNMRPRLSREAALAVMYESDFNVDRSATRLLSLYERSVEASIRRC